MSAAVLQLGPLVLPVPLLIQAAGLVAAVWVGKRIARQGGRTAELVAEVEARLLRLFWIGLAAARLAYVWSWREAYLAQPLSMLDVRDGGWDAVAGYAAASLVGLGQLSRQPRLRRPYIAAFVLALTGWVGAEATRIAWPAHGQTRLPALRLATPGGRELALDTLAGRPVVLNLWATWCPPCRHEMPMLLQAQAAHPEVEFVFVDQGEARDEVVRYLQQQPGLAALRNVLLDPARASGAAFDARALPTTLFFDARGELVSTRIGLLSEATLAQRLAQIHPATGAPSRTRPAIPPAAQPTAPSPP
jgi:thiol-disulfide isomerase/thioredoxin